MKIIEEFDYTSEYHKEMCLIMHEVGVSYARVGTYLPLQLNCWTKTMLMETCTSD